MSNSKFDCVVIGAGLAGMSAAITVATQGKKVLLLDQHNLPGGCASSFVRGRFEFDASLHEYCGLGKKGEWGLPGRIMMEEHKLNIDWLYIPEMYRCIGTTRSGKHFDITLPTGIENVINKMEEVVPGSREPMRVFLSLAKECVDANDYFSAHMSDVKKDGFLKTDSLYFMKHFSNFLKVAERPFNEVMRNIGMPEDAIDILDVYWTYIGADYEKMSFVHQAWMFYMYAKYEPTICRDNAHGMTMACIERLRSLGGELWLNTRALKVCGDKDGNITGVLTDVGMVETNYVIANVNPEIAYNKLLDENIKVPEREYKRVNAEKHGIRFFNAYVACNKSVEELGIKDYTIFMPGSLDNAKNIKDATSYEDNTHSVVVIYNVVNPDASPKGTTVMTFTICYTEDVWGDFTQREYVHKKQELFKKVMDNFEHDTGIIIHDCIEEIELASPWTFAHFLNTPEGTVYGYRVDDWDTMLSRLMAIRKDQPIKGFKTCGAAGARGDGYNMTYTNGNDIGKIILEEMEGK